MSGIATAVVAGSVITGYMASEAQSDAASTAANALPNLVANSMPLRNCCSRTRMLVIVASLVNKICLVSTGPKPNKMPSVPSSPVQHINL